MPDIKELEEAKKALDKIFDSIKESQTPKASLGDKGLMATITENVISELLERGLIADKLLTPIEAMEMLQIKHRHTLKKYMDKGLHPIYPHKNARPRYRLSDVSRYIRMLS